MTNEEEVANGIVTQYTINDIICPPTNSTVLKYIVQKHIDTLPKYLESKPIAQYNVDAFHEALQFVAEFQQKRLHSCGEKGRVNVILDSGCGTGRSTRILGNMFPDWAVIGIE
jgi:tRNA G46 methylase TrmB